MSGATMHAPASAQSAAPPAGADALLLRDIHLPPNPSLWPPAPGWWLLLAVLLLLALIAAVLWRRRQARHRRHARMLAELDRLTVADDAALAAGLHQWLRRAARVYEPAAVRLRGDAWRQVLAQIPVDAATLEQLLTLEQRMYRPTAGFDRAAAIAATRRWLTLALRRRPMRAANSKASAHA